MSTTGAPRHCRESTTMTERTIPAKPHKVTGPDGQVHFAYAPTKQGAVTAVREHLKQEEKWTAELASGEDLFLAAKNGTEIINAPASMRAPEPQADAFTEQ